MFKKNNTTQNVCKLTENNTAYDDKLDAFEAHAELLQDCLAWEMDSFQQAIDEKTKRFIQFIGERSYRPIKIFRSLQNGNENDTNITTIASQTEDQEMVFLDEGKKKDGRLLWLGICLCLVTITIMAAVYMKMKGG